MGWLIEQFFDDVISALASRIHRKAGWAGCVIVLAVLAALIALVVWLLILLAYS